jgi:RNA polymerase sigma-70 factor (ECF subfamily)
MNTPEDEFTHLVVDYGPRLLGYLARRTNSAEDAADLLAELFTVAWRRHAELPTEPDALLPWLYGVGRRVLANHRRGNIRRSALAEHLRAYAGTIEPDPASLTDTALDVRRALAQLPDQDREILQLVAWEQLSVTQAGQVLGLRPAAARQRLHRSRGHLRRLLDAEPASRWQPRPGEPASQAGTTAT